MGDPVDLNELRRWARTTTEIVDAADGERSIVVGRADVLAVLDAYRITREALDEMRRVMCSRCEADIAAARVIAAADALVTPEGNTDD